MISTLRSKLTKLFLTSLLCTSTLAFAHSNWDERYELFLEDVLENSINVYFWDHLTREKYIVTQKARLPISDEEAFRKAVSHALKDLQDNHSFLPPKPSDETKGNIDQPAYFADPHYIKVVDGVGMISVPSVSINLTTGEENNFLAKEWVDQYQSELASIFPQVTKGWIIDLRENGGGSMFPMISALSLFLDSEIVGGFTRSFDPGGEKFPISFDGQTFSSLEESEKLSLTKKYPVNSNKHPVSVLIGPGTASSGEFVALTLKRQQNTTLLGKPSWGLASANAAVELPDNMGYYMITSALYLDENDNPLTSRIVFPDVESDLEGDDLIEYCIEQFSH